MNKRRLLSFIVFLLLSSMGVRAQAPSIVTNPASSAVCAGNNVNFSVVANNATGYQWQLSTNGGGTWSNLSNTLPYTNVTTSVMNVNAPSASLSGYQFRCFVTGASLPNATSLAGTLTVNPPPAVTVQPPTQTIICMGGNASITTTITGALSLQWYADFGAGFLPLVNNAIFSGVTTNTLGITGANGATIGTYRCIGTNACGATPTNTSVLLVYANTAITTNPSTITNCTGGYTYFTVAATGSGLTYQWQESTNGGATFSNLSNNATYGGVTSTQLTIANTPFSLNANQYRCFVIGTCLSSATSTAATLNLNTPPSVTGNPSSTTICQAANTSFTASGTGTSIAYQWQESTNNGASWTNLTNVAPYSNVTTSTMNITAAPAGYSGNQYRCAISGICTPSPAHTTAAILTVTPFVAVTAQPPVGGFMCAGGNTSISFTHTGGTTFQWYCDFGAGFVALSNNATYSGVNTATLNITNGSVGNTGTYRCIFSNGCSGPIATGTSYLNIYPTTAITTNPSSTTSCAGANSYFSVTASGSTLNYQWQVSTNGGGTWANLANTAPYAGVTTSTMSILGTLVSYNNNQYRCNVIGACLSSANSTGATLSVNTNPLTAITAQPAANGSVCVGSNTSISCTATNATGFQWQIDQGAGFANVTNVAPFSGATTATLNITNATLAANGTYRCIVSGTCNALNTNTSVLNVNPITAITSNPSSSTTCAGANSYFNVTAVGGSLSYQWQLSTNGGGTWANLTNTAPYAGVLTNGMSVIGTLVSQNNYQFRCNVTGVCAPVVNSTAATLNVNTNPLTAITTQPPVSTTVCLGAATSISCAASNATGFQWQVDLGAGFVNVTNVAPYSGATTATLNISSASAGTMGTYRCVVSGTCNALNTNTSTLNVYANTAITTQPSSITNCTGGFTYFSVAATGASLNYQWQLSTNGGGTWTNITNTAPYSGVTSNQLTISNTSIALNANQYRCFVIGTCLSSATSNAAVLTLNTPPSVTANPTNATTCFNSSATFSASGTGSSISYQWQLSTDAGTTWNNLTNTAPYSNVNGTTMTISTAPVSMSGYQYRCAIIGICPVNPALTSPASLTVTPPISITTQPPVSAFICTGVSTSISFTHVGGANFQWYGDFGAGFVALTNNATYSGVNAATLNIANATVAATGTYRCVFSNACSGPIATGTSVLNVYPLTAITSNPSSTVSCAGANAYFNVTATGASLTYQWQVSTNSGATWANLTNNTPYAGVLTNSMSILGTLVSYNNNQYRCNVTGTCSSVANSTGATLSVNTNPLTAITTQPPVSTFVCTGSPTSISCAASNATSFQWQIDQGSGFVNVANVAPYSGANTATLSISSASAATNGTYRCNVNGACNGINTNTSVLNVYLNTAITTQPTALTNCSGSNSFFTVAATGSILNYQWQVSTNGGTTWNNLANTAPYSAVTSNQLTITGTPASLNANQYRCYIIGACLSAATSNAVALTVNTPPAVTVNPSNSTVCFNTATSFSAAGTGTGISYQWQLSTNGGSSWSNLTNVAPYSNVTATTMNISSATVGMNTNQYRCAISGICPNTPALTTGGILTVTPPVSVTTQPPVSQSSCTGVNATITFSHVGGTSFQWYGDFGSGFVALANNANFSGVTTNTLTVLASAVTNGTYRCFFSNNCSGPIATNTSILNVYPPTVITLQPSSVTSCTNSNSYFTVQATGTTLTYQWQISTNGGVSYANLTNNTPYGGVTTNQLTIFNTPIGINTFRFRCAVSGLCLPAVNSNGAILTVNTPPSITTQPVKTTACQNGNATISVVAAGTGLTYQWRVNTGAGFVNVTNTGVYSGATTANLLITGATTAMNGYQYYCTVSGSCAPPVNTNTILFGITPTASITTQPAANTTVCANSTTTLSLSHLNGTTFQWYGDFGSGFAPLVNNANFNNVNTATLTINATTAQNGSYRCIVGNGCMSVTSITAVVNVYPAPSVTTQPKPVVTCQGINAYFTVGATGTGLTYQWQVSTNSGNTWANLTETLPYAGVTSSSLSIFGALNSFNNNQYRCYVSGLCSPSVASDGAVLTVKPQPYISTYPANTTVNQYTDAQFHVQGTDVVGYKYYWQMSRDGVHYADVINDPNMFSGAQTKDLTVIKAFYALNGNMFRCILAGDLSCYLDNADTTAGAMLTVKSYATNVTNTANVNTNITIYPNPVNGTEMTVKVENPSTKNLHFRIVDQFGRTLQSEDMTLSQLNNATVNVGKLVPGVYVIQFSDKNNESIQAIRFTKQQ